LALFAAGLALFVAGLALLAAPVPCAAAAFFDAPADFSRVVALPTRFAFFFAAMAAILIPYLDC
jgi:hypothetical protein